MDGVLNSLRLITNGMYALSSTLECFLRLRYALGFHSRKPIRGTNNSFIVEYTPASYSNSIPDDLPNKDSPWTKLLELLGLLIETLFRRLRRMLRCFMRIL